MAKGQRRSNREVKKPKQPKAQSRGTLAVTAAAPAGRERLLLGDRDQPGPRKGRR
jgi:hypothetical protein